MKAIFNSFCERIKKWWNDIRICSDCGEEKKTIILSHYFAAQWQVYMNWKSNNLSRPIDYPFMGVHKYSICDKCWNNWTAWEMNLLLNTFEGGETQGL